MDGEVHRSLPGDVVLIKNIMSIVIARSGEQQDPHRGLGVRVMPGNYSTAESINLLFDPSENHELRNK